MVNPLIKHLVLRSYSRIIGSEGFWPQLVCCAPFPSIAPYFRSTEVLGLKIQTYNILISKGYPDNGNVNKTNLDASRLQNNRVYTI